MSRRYFKASATVNENGWTDWWAPRRRGYRLACCTCGLVHIVNHRVRNGVLEWQFAIDRRATAGMRRGRRFAAIRKALTDG